MLVQPCYFCSKWGYCPDCKLKLQRAAEELVAPAKGPLRAGGQVKTPLHTVLFGMFPNAMKALAEHSQFGSTKHNPGEPLHWAFDKSTQHADCVLSHLAKAGQTDPETGRSHTWAAFWRMAALLETELVNAGAEPGFAVRFEGQAKGQPERWYVQFNQGNAASPDWFASASVPGEFVSEAEANRAIDAFCEEYGEREFRHEWRPCKEGSK